MPSTSISQHERDSVWVPASARTTAMLSPRPPLTIRRPRAGGDPVTTGSSLCADAIDQHLSTRAGTAYGSLRPKERHRCCRRRAALSQHGPRRCMVAGAFLGPYAAIDAGLG